MEIFYIDPESQLCKTYENLFEDLNLDLSNDSILDDSDTYLLFLKMIRKILKNENFFILDSDISIEEKREISPPSIYESNTNQTTFKMFKGFDLFTKQILLSSSEISILTSGTTGKPKKVVHTIKSLTRSVKYNYTADNAIWALAYNPTHIAGLQVFFQALLNKNTLVDVFGLSRTKVYDALNTYKVTHISATPTFYRLLFPFERVFNHVVRITFGGEKSDIVLYKKIEQIFPNAKLTNIYASTELGTLFVSDGEKFSIPKNLQEDIVIDENNELLVRAELLGRSDELIIVDGFYKTGDIVEVLSRNPIKFIFKSRLGDYVNIGGIKVNLQEILDVMVTLNGVKMASVSIKSNSVLGNVLIGSIVSDGTNPNLTESYIRSQLKDHLQYFKIPRVIKFVEELEFSRTGKILKINK